MRAEHCLQLEFQSTEDTKAEKAESVASVVFPGSLSTFWFHELTKPFFFFLNKPSCFIGFLYFD